MCAKRESKGNKNTVRSKKKRSSPRRKKPKVLLNSKYVCILCASIVFFCAVLLGTTFLLNGGGGSSVGSNGGAVQEGNIASLSAPEKKVGKEAGKSGAGTKPSTASSDSNGSAKTGNGSVSSAGNAAGTSAGNAGAVESNANSGSANVGKENAANVGRENLGKENGSYADGSGKNASGGHGAAVNTDQGVASVQKPHGPDGGIQEARPKSNIPPAKNAAKLAFVIDDGGMSVANVKKYTALPFPITVAVLPGLPHTAECAALVRRDGKELMLHQPMQAKNLGINPGPGAITPDMDSWAIQQVIEKNLGELGPGVKGFNNHEGSLITEDKLKMTFIIDLAMQKGLYFLDSRTTSQTQARQAALELDTHIIERNAPFLDNAVNREEMLAEIYKGLEVANRAGFAVIIGHVDKSAAVLPRLLEDMYPELVAKGYVFTTPSRL
ncbi:MAG: divergent polysaccharide deacetylase family protein [Treponema sp.]|nr:divergent polysaccharide deacetylase family protein [Treponema sp.]